MEGIIGEIRLWASNFAPAAWMFCEGQTLPIREYEALFTVLGTTYGGDGVTTFKLPDLRGRVPIGVGSGPGLTRREPGEVLGVPTVTLTESQLPAHRHGIPASNAAASVASPVAATPATSESIKPYAQSADATMAAGAIGAAGGGQAHDNMQPYAVVRYVVCVEGIYPSRW